MSHRNRCVMPAQPQYNSADIICRMHSHACLLDIHPLHLKTYTDTWPQNDINLYTCTCIAWLFNKLHSSVIFSISLEFFLSNKDIFLVLSVSPIPHFLLYHLVWLWGLGCRDNGGHRPFRLCLQSFCCCKLIAQWLLGQRSLAPPSPTHTLSHTCRRKWFLRNISEKWSSSCYLKTCRAVTFEDGTKECYSLLIYYELLYWINLWRHFY